ncbi:MAG TPA: peptidylprolyl isomerase [Erysipelotrichaceae bacterium]|nr:peptidylprolyl isomerase [Erysipelotrichaceae bacterium]
MLAVIKRQWFVVLVAVLLCAIIVFFVYDQNKDNLPSKSVGGKDVVFTVADTDVTTDEFYSELYKQYGISAVYMFLEKAIVDSAIETTEVITTKADVDATSVTESFKSYYGTEYESYLIEALKGLGYSKVEDLNTYFVYVYKRQALMNDYLNANMDTLYPAFSEVNTPRVVSHVLVTMADPAAPTADETARFEAAKAAYAGGMSFEEMVTNYSDDTSNNTNKGKLGYLDVNTSYVPEFLSAALALNEGEVSDWVKTQYGYHLIRVDSTNLETLKEYQEFYDALLASDTTLEPTIVWAKAQELNIDFMGNDELKAELLSFMGIEE